MSDSFSLFVSSDFSALVMSDSSSSLVSSDLSALVISDSLSFFVTSDSSDSVTSDSLSSSFFSLSTVSAVNTHIRLKSKTSHQKTERKIRAKRCLTSSSCNLCVIDLKNC